ncbi:hypothetical protein EV361DRAFT_566813 [Lentinula raphanica]|nr:hypothetical protein EV361DRAFT_566813 [Lentinula raphanica]
MWLLVPLATERLAAEHHVVVVLVQGVLEGCYFLLFTTAIYYMRQCKRGRSHKYSITALVALFMFATISLILHIIGTAGGIVFMFEENPETIGLDGQAEEARLLNTLEVLVLLMYLVTNIAADAILLYRLYVIWGFRWRTITVIPLIVIILNNALGIIDVGFCFRIAFNPYLWILAGSPQNIFWAADGIATLTRAFMITNLVVHTFLTGLIAGKIWWIDRRFNASYGGTGRRSLHKYARSVLAIILESGVLYPVAIFVALLVGLTPNSPNMLALLVEIMAIAPTLIIVRVSLSVNEVDAEPSVQQQSRGPAMTHTTLQDDLEVRALSSSSSSGRLRGLDVDHKISQLPHTVTRP